MSKRDDDETVSAVRAANDRAIRLLKSYWRRHGVEITVDRAGQELVTDLVNGLPRGYRGDEAVRVKR